LERGTASRDNYAYGVSVKGAASRVQTVNSFLSVNSEAYQQEVLAWIDDGKAEAGSAAEYMDIRDGWIAQNILQVAERRLREVARTEEERAWLSYFEARRLQLEGNTEGCRSAFSAILDSPHGFPFRGDAWRQFLTIEQAACLELGRIADGLGERDTATQFYNRALASIRIPEYDSGYFSDCIHFVTAVNAIRPLAAEGYRSGTAAVMKRQEAGSSTSSAMEREIQTMMELNRASRWGEALNRARSLLSRADVPSEIRYQSLRYSRICCRSPWRPSVREILSRIRELRRRGRILYLGRAGIG
jgi:tetratricopeptide (TPR) repeat protein